MAIQLRIAVFGGAGEIGGNRILLSWDDAAWMLDFGTRFAATSHYFEEFVKPSGATLGLRDYLRMGLLPPLEGLYRDDLCCHEPDLWERYRNHPDYRRVPELKACCSRMRTWTTTAAWDFSSRRSRCTPGS